MRVARTYAIDRTVVEEEDRPEPAEGEAIVRVRACGVCASDAADWYVARKAPTVLGHEPVGDVVSVGAGVDGVAEGDRVFFHHHVPCGECAHCRRGVTTSCRMFRETKLDPGGFAEFVRVPRENLARDTLRVPDGVSDEAATFIEPLACSLRAFKKAPPGPDDAVLVIGLGVMGLLNVQVARHLGARHVFATDFVESRRRMAQRLGANACWDPRETDPAAQIRERTDGRGADVVIVGPPMRAAMDAGYEAAAPGATIVLFAPYPDDAVWELAPARFYFGEMKLTASYSCDDRDTREALTLIETNAIRVEDLVTHRFGLEETGRAIELTAGKSDALKSIVYPHGVPAEHAS